MYSSKLIAATLVSCLLGCTSAIAADPTAANDAFKPFKLVGGWDFTSINSGRKYSGDVRIEVNTFAANGVMQGKVSFDGRQTNDNCSTRGVFNDDPVEADIRKTSVGYDVSFMLKCLKGESPRARQWTLACEGDTCTRPEVLPNGKGMLTVKQVD